jgi:hypothetical protein
MRTTIKDVTDAYEAYRNKTDPGYCVFGTCKDVKSHFNYKFVFKIRDICNTVGVTPQEYIEYTLRTRTDRRTLHLSALAGDRYSASMLQEAQRRLLAGEESLDILKNQVTHLMDTWGISKESAILEVKRMLGISEKRH